MGSSKVGTEAAGSSSSPAAVLAATGLLAATKLLTTPTMEQKAEEGLVVEKPFVDNLDIDLARIAEKLPSKSRRYVLCGVAIIILSALVYVYLPQLIAIRGGAVATPPVW